MSASSLVTMLGRFQQFVSATRAEELSDGELLKQFTTEQSQQAFAALVWRHGALVWRVCRRILGPGASAEDAFQATFVLLLRKARSIRKPAVLPSWLHGVAFRVACQLRRKRERARPASRPERPAVADPAQEAALREVGHIIEEEVHRLTENLRLPIVSCYWEGKTNEEAARALGWPCGTVKTRLAKARAVLHARLLRRGVTLPAGVITLLLAPRAGEAAAPVGLTATTVKALGGGPGAVAVSAKVAALADAAYRGWVLASWKPLLLLTVALSAAALGGAFLQAPSAEKDSEAKAAATQPAAKAQATDSDRTVAGIVVDPRDHPVAGADVELLQTGTPLRAVSGKDGRFLLTASGSLKLKYGFAITARSRDGEQLAYLRVEDSDQKRDMQSLRLVIKPARRVEVAVTEGAGLPAVGSRAGVLSHLAIVARGVVDDQGRAALRVPADCALEYVYAWRSGAGFDYRCFLKPVRGSLLEAAPALPQGAIALRLGGAASLRVTAVDGERRPVAKLPLYVWYLQKPGETNDINLSGAVEEFASTTDDQGVAIFDWLPSWQEVAFTIWARSEEYAHRRLPWDPKKDANAVSLALQRLEVIRGRVTHANGAAAAGITIQADGKGYDFDGYRGETKTDAAGKYELRVPPNLLYLVVMVDKNWAAEPQTGFAVFPKTPVPDKNFVLRPATVVHGRLTLGKAQAPYAGQYMYLTQGGADNLALPNLLPNPEKSRLHVQPTIGRNVKTDADGRFQFRVGPGQYQLRGPEQVKGVSFTVTDEPQLEFNLNALREETGRLTGIVIAGTPAKPVANAVIEGIYKAPSGRSEPKAKTNADGRFEVERQRHPMVLHARSADGKLASVIEIGPDEPTVVVPLAKVASAKGRLIDAATGQALAGREIVYGVRVPSSEGPNSAFRTAFGGTVTTDRDGRFELKGLVAGQKQHVHLTQEDKQSWRTLQTFLPEPDGAVDLGELRVKRDPPPPPAAERK